MITLLRKIRKQLVRENKISSYLLYAIGEIALVVIGILIALQINTWNQNRINRNIERGLLAELIENLIINEDHFRTSIKGEYKTAQSIEYVANSLENKMPYHDSMDYHYWRVDFGADMVVSNTGFEAIKSRGFEIISSDSLRQAIISLFDTEYNNLVANTVRLEDLFWPTRSLPFFQKHFRVDEMRPQSLEDLGLTARPVNYKALLKDEEYINMIKHRGHFRYLGALLKQDALEKTTALKEEIISYLEN